MIQFKGAAKLLALALLVACQLDGRFVSASGSVRVLDKSEPLNIEAIARVMCESKSKRDGQISRLSTLDKLAEFFDQQVSGESHALFKCKQQHGKAFRKLQEVLNASKENVCSAEKLALIEDFHNQFVSSHVEHKKSFREEQSGAAPQLLRLFFMRYAMEVDAVCRRNLTKNLESDLKQKLGGDIVEKLFKPAGTQVGAPFGVVFKRAMQKFNDLLPASQCEHVLILWDLIESSFLSQKMEADTERIYDQFDPITGEPVRMLARVKTTRHLKAIKEHCHYNLKPIYSKLILPLIKLADLGYSNSGEHAAKSSEELKRWYSATQMCEALLPVKYYEDPSLGPEDFVVITKREAAMLDDATGAAAGEPKVQLVYEPDTNSMKGVDLLDSVATVEPKQLVKSVKSNLKARRHVIGRAVIKLVRNIKSGSKKSRAGHIFLSKPAHPKSGVEVDQFAEEDVSQELSESLESMSDEDIAKLEGSAPSRMLGSGGLVKRRGRHGLPGLWSEIFSGFKDALAARKNTFAKIGLCIVVLISGLAAGAIIVAFMSG